MSRNLRKTLDNLFHFGCPYISNARLACSSLKKCLAPAAVGSENYSAGNFPPPDRLQPPTHPPSLANKRETRQALSGKFTFRHRCALVPKVSRARPPSVESAGQLFWFSRRGWVGVSE